MREKLLGYLHSVFDKDPEAVPVIRISASGNAQWEVKDRTLTVKNSFLGNSSEFDLTGYTLRELVQEIRYAGFSVTVIKDGFLDRPSDILLEGFGDEGNGYNGDTLYAFTSPLWSILNTVGLTLEETHQNACIEGVNQAYFDRARDYWLDVWGMFFGINRLDGQDDESYLAAIIEEVLRLRNNHYAMKNAVEKITGIKVFIHELWKDRYSVGGSNPLPADDDEVYCRFDIITEETLTADQEQAVLEVIEATRPVGVLCQGFSKLIYKILSTDIDFEPVFDYQLEDATWRVPHEWQKGMDGNDARWDEQIYSGFSISMALVLEILKVIEPNPANDQCDSTYSTNASSVQSTSAADIVFSVTPTHESSAQATEASKATAFMHVEQVARENGWQGVWGSSSWNRMNAAADIITAVEWSPEKVKATDRTTVTAVIHAATVSRNNGWNGHWDAANWRDYIGAKDAVWAVDSVVDSASPTDESSVRADMVAVSRSRPDGWIGAWGSKIWNDASARDYSETFEHVIDKAAANDNSEVYALMAPQAVARLDGWSGKWSSDNWNEAGKPNDTVTAVDAVFDSATPSDSQSARADMVASGISRVGAWDSSDWNRVGADEASDAVS